MSIAITNIADSASFFIVKGYSNSDSNFPDLQDEESLSKLEAEKLKKLKETDRKVRQHENAHQMAAGTLFKGKSLKYTAGPDGKRYAVSGEVQIDVAPVPNNPEATIRKMQQVKRAALAPADPSMQDRKIASEAARKESKARMEILKENISEIEEDLQFTNSNNQTSKLKSSPLFVGLLIDKVA